jgi:hypothetical protein
MKYYQHGDVLLKTDNIELTTPEVAQQTLHAGEQHNHVLTGRFRYDDAKGELQVLEPSTLTHDEHKPITLPVGGYKKSIVVEYDHFLEESRQVID